MESFIIAVNAVMPFLIYISFGYGVRTSGLVDEAFMNRLNKLIFRAFFPILMFNNMYQIKGGFKLNVLLVITAVSSVLILQLILIIIVPRIVKRRPAPGRHHPGYLPEQLRALRNSSGLQPFRR